MEGPKPSSDYRGSALRVLVVDDCLDTARMMRVLLRGQGYDVQLARNGAEAIEVAVVFRPEAVLVDIGLPDVDGFEVASQLRRQECCRNALIIAVSGYGSDEDRRRSSVAGFDHHLVKPVDHHALTSLLSAAANGRG